MIDTTAGDPLDPRRVAFWDAVNRYVRACGGDTGAATAGDERMDAVVAVEQAARAYAAPTPHPSVPVPAPPSAEGEVPAAAEGATPVSTYDGRTWLSTGSGAAPASGEAHAPEAPETCDACGADEPDPHKTDCPKTIGPYIGGRCSGCGWANNLWVRVRCRNCRAPLPDTKVPPAASPPSPKDADEGAERNEGNEGVEGGTTPHTGGDKA
jgi:hypothetical protein